MRNVTRRGGACVGLSSTRIGAPCHVTEPVPTGLLSIIGVLGVLWGGSNVGGAISTVFQPIFHVKGRSFLVEKLIDVGMIIVFTALMLVIIGATAAGALLNRLISSFRVRSSSWSGRSLR